jgi:hypothetical protein
LFGGRTGGEITKNKTYGNPRILDTRLPLQDLGGVDDSCFPKDRHLNASSICLLGENSFAFIYSVASGEGF